MHVYILGRSRPTAAHGQHSRARAGTPTIPPTRNTCRIIYTNIAALSPTGKYKRMILCKLAKSGRWLLARATRLRKNSLSRFRLGANCFQNADFIHYIQERSCPHLWSSPFILTASRSDQLLSFTLSLALVFRSRPRLSSSLPLELRSCPHCLLFSALVLNASCQPSAFVFRSVVKDAKQRNVDV